MDSGNKGSGSQSPTGWPAEPRGGFSHKAGGRTADKFEFREFSKSSDRSGGKSPAPPKRIEPRKETLVGGNHHERHRRRIFKRKRPLDANNFGR